MPLGQPTPCNALSHHRISMSVRFKVQGSNTRGDYGVFYPRNITLLFRCSQGLNATWPEMSEFNTPEAITTTEQLPHSNVVG